MFLQNKPAELCRILVTGEPHSGRTRLFYSMMLSKPVGGPSSSVRWSLHNHHCILPLDCPISADPNEPIPKEWIDWHRGWAMNGVLREERENDIRLRIQLSHIRMATSLALTGGELTNVICLCIPIEDPESLNSIPDKWLPIIKHVYPHVPIVLVGCKNDLRNKVPPTHLITSEQGASLARRIGAEAYIECSSHTEQNVERVFQFLCWTGARHMHNRANRSCIIM